MTIEKFIENFAEAIDVLVPEINADMDYKQHPNWDSMAVLSVIAMVDEYYSKVLTGEEIEDAVTVQQLFLKISSK